MKKEAAKAKNQSWLTTDEEERAKRRERAKVESMRVRAVDAPQGFGTYEVSHPAADHRTTTYHVEIRSIDRPVNTCDCPDFLKSGLGTCKHIERVLGNAARRAGATRESPAGEVFMCRDPYRPQFLPGAALGEEAKRTLLRACDARGLIRDASAAGVDVFLRTCARLNEVVPGSVRVSAEVRTWLDDRTRREALARTVSEFRDEQGEDGRWPFLKHALYPYQREGVLHLAGKGRALLADEMGLGKTVQAIAAALLLRDVGFVKRTLVVVPASLKGEWEEQIRFFSDATVTLLYGQRQTRLDCYRSVDSFFLVANYEQVIRDWKEINELLHPDLVILDEAQRIKNWKTKTARNLKGLRSPYAFVLTGTPLENRIEELYSLVEFVDPMLFGSLFRFNRRFYAFDDEGHNEGMRDLAKLHDATQQILLRRRKASVEDDLPGRRTKTYKTSMTPEQSRRYDEHFRVVAELCQRAKKRPLTPKELDRLQIELSMMRMLCDSCYILDLKVKDSPKLDEFMQVLDDVFSDDPTRKVIVFSEWTRMLDLVIERFEEKGIGYALHTGLVPQKRRREEICRFKEDPKCRVFLASESGGVGLNLQVASVVVNLDLPWNPAKLEQRIARAWRKRQTRDVLVVNMVSAGTIEERMLQTLGFKQGLADFVLDAMGDASDFERQNSEEKKGKRKESAFMQRLKSVMGDAKDEAGAAMGGAPATGVVADLAAAGVAAQGAAAASTGAADKVAEKGFSSEARLREAVAKACPGEEIVTPEVWAALEKLCALGLVSLCGAAAPDASKGESAEDAAKREAARRVARAEELFADVWRKLDMGGLLISGGFVEEGQQSLRSAVTLAAGIAHYAHGAGDVEAKVDPVTVEDLVSVGEALALDRESALTLQFSAQDRELPDAVSTARRFVDAVYGPR